MNRIATCGGYELYEDGPRLVFVERPTGGIDIALFVVGLLTLITGVNGVVWAVQLATPALVLLPIALVFGGIFALLWRWRRSTKQRPPGDLPALLILDRAQNAVCNGSGQPIAPLQGAVVREAFQLASSSKQLELACSAGTFSIARGSPFSGSIHDIADALRQRGIRVG
jgi:hypothetical protein